VTGPWRKPRKWNLPLTYEPKIPGVIDGTIRQTIRVGRKFRVGDLVSFHGWEGRPYRSKWSFRTPYFTLTMARAIRIVPGGIVVPPRPLHGSTMRGERSTTSRRGTASSRRQVRHCAMCSSGCTRSPPTVSKRRF
jgi:hypothetical protein